MAAAVIGLFAEDVLVPCLEAAEELRCARLPHGAWHRLPGVERLMLELCVLSVCALQVRCSADSFRFPQGWSYLGPSSERRGAT